MVEQRKMFAIDVAIRNFLQNKPMATNSFQTRLRDWYVQEKSRFSYVRPAENELNILARIHPENYKKQRSLPLSWKQTQERAQDAHYGFKNIIELLSALVLQEIIRKKMFPEAQNSQIFIASDSDDTLGKIDLIFRYQIQDVTHHI
jgi:hypothetical protein